jgi:hypothetical protein
MINLPQLKSITTAIFELKDYFQRKLNLPCCGCSPGQQARCRVRGSSSVENICIDSLNGRREIRVIENVEKLGAELDVEPLRDPLDVVVLEQGKVQRGDTGTYQDVAAGITAKIEALRKNGCGWRS